MKKTVLIIIILLVIVGGGYFIFRGGYQIPGYGQPSSPQPVVPEPAQVVPEPVQEADKVEEAAEAPVEAPAEAPAEEPTPPAEPEPTPPAEPEPTPPAEPEPTPPAEPEPVVAAPVVKSFTMTAKKFDFIPSTITVNEGDTVILTITSTDVTHGFSLPAFGINVNLVSGQTETVSFTADKNGTFPFRCSVACGSGHGGMRGSLIVK